MIAARRVFSLGIVFALAAAAPAAAQDTSFGRELLRLTSRQRRYRGKTTHFPITWALSPDGRWIANDQDGRTLGLTEAESSERRELATLAPTEPLGAMAFSPDGKTLAASIARGAEVTVHLHDLRSEGGAEPRGIVLDGYCSGLLGLAWSLDGKLIAGREKMGKVTVWDVAAGKQVRRVPAGTGSDRASRPYGPRATDPALVFLDGGAKIAASSTHADLGCSFGMEIDGWCNFHVFDVRTGEKEPLRSIDGIYLAATPDGGTVVTKDGEGITIADLATQKPRKVIPAPGRAPWAVAITDDAKWLAVSDGEAITVWSVESGAEKGRIEAKGVAKLAFSASGTRLAGQLEDCSVVLWLVGDEG